jgi:hypothetical protein
LGNPPTLICLGFEWYIEGDYNRNANVDVEYRVKEQKCGKNIVSLIKISKEKAGTPEWNNVTPNIFSGRMINLQPGTEYECRFTGNDPKYKE